jgi:hypothetical protein
MMHLLLLSQKNMMAMQGYIPLFLLSAMAANIFRIGKILEMV